MEVSAKGFDGQISFDGRSVTITRKGFNARMQHHGGGDTVVPISQVSGVEFKPLGIQRGRITIIAGGALQRRGGVFAHRDDPMSVQFMSHGGDFRAVRDAITSALVSPAGPVFAPHAQPLEARFAELGRLRADGVLSEEEFAAAKTRLLAGD